MNWWLLLLLTGMVALWAVLLLRRTPLLALGVLLAGSTAAPAIHDNRLLLVSLVLPIMLTELEAASSPRPGRAGCPLPRQ